MLPWISIETSPMGTTRPCCLALDEIVDSAGNKFNLNSTNLETVYHSEYMQNLRRQFRRGDKPETCSRCWSEEDAGRDSKRINSQIRLKELYSKVDWENDNPDQLWFVDLKLGNICNLKCRICGSWSSSNWATEEMNYLPAGVDKKSHIAYQWLMEGAWPRKTETFWDNMRDLIPNIKYFEFTGGEPWMIKEHFELLQYAVDQGYSKNIDIHYNTNATHQPDEYLNLWSNFGRVDIAFSIDNVGTRFEYERFGAKWQEANEIVNKVHNQSTVSNITTQLCFTINIQNVYYLDELLDWADTKPWTSIYFNVLHDPQHMNIQHMTENAKELVLTKLKTTAWKSDFYRQEIENITKFIENGPGSDGADFMFHMKRTDAYRNQNFTTTHPEIAIAMGY